MRETPNRGNLRHIKRHSKLKKRNCNLSAKEKRLQVKQTARTSYHKASKEQRITEERGASRNRV